jgi:serine/threonine-protein kinase HipA
MADIEVHINIDGRMRPVGRVRSSKMQGSENVFCEYAPAWLAEPYRFAPVGLEKP